MTRLEQRSHRNVVAVALANRIAHCVGCAGTSGDVSFRSDGRDVSGKRPNGVLDLTRFCRDCMRMAVRSAHTSQACPKKRPSRPGQLLGQTCADIHRGQGREPLLNRPDTFWQTDEPHLSKEVLANSGRTMHFFEHAARASLPRMPPAYL